MIIFKGGSVSIKNKSTKKYFYQCLVLFGGFNVVCVRGGRKEGKGGREGHKK